MKKIIAFLKQIIYIIISLIISFIFCYKVVDQILFNTSVPYSINIIIRFILAFIIYFAIKWIEDGKINYKYVNFIYFIYFVFLIYGLTFSRVKLNYNPAYNLNLIEILDQPIIITLINFILFIPLGTYVKEFKYKFLIILLAPISIELIQLISKTGIFDIGDIILNALGGLLGLHIYKIIYIIKIKGDKHEKI